MTVLTIPINGVMTKVICQNDKHHRAVYGAILTWGCNCPNETKTTGK